MFDHTELLEQLKDTEYIHKASLIGMILVLNTQLLEQNSSDEDVQTLYLKLQTLYELIAFDQEYKLNLPL